MPPEPNLHLLLSSLYFLCVFASLRAKEASRKDAKAQRRESRFLLGMDAKARRSGQTDENLAPLSLERTHQLALGQDVPLDGLEQFGFRGRLRVQR